MITTECEWIQTRAYYPPGEGPPQPIRSDESEPVTEGGVTALRDTYTRNSEAEKWDGETRPLTYISWAWVINNNNNNNTLDNI